MRYNNVMVNGGNVSHKGKLLQKKAEYVPYCETIGHHKKITTIKPSNKTT